MGTTMLAHADGAKSRAFVTPIQLSWTAQFQHVCRIRMQHCRAESRMMRQEQHLKVWIVLSDAGLQLPRRE